MAKSKLNVLQKGAISGSCQCYLGQIKAGGKLEFKGLDDFEGVEFSIKSVSYNLNANGLISLVEFEG